MTDANLVLGRINPDRPIGGKLSRLDIDAARAAIAAEVGAPLGLEPEAAAEAVLKVANAKMAGAIRLVSIERGHDPAKFADLQRAKFIMGLGHPITATVDSHQVDLVLGALARLPREQDRSRLARSLDLMGDGPFHASLAQLV